MMLGIIPFSTLSTVEIVATCLLLLFVIERLGKCVLVLHFFAKKPPESPQQWPTLSVIQPITRGVCHLQGNLISRLSQDYAQDVQHIFLCDAHDGTNKQIAYDLAAQYRDCDVVVVEVQPDNGEIASKVKKMQLGHQLAVGEVLVFIDDDIELRPAAFTQMVPYLYQKNIGAVFGLAWAANWNSRWSAMMNLFVNGFALMTYIPLCYCTRPYSITGHIFALKKSVYEQSGALDNFSGRIGDDHEIAKNVRALGLELQQSPVMYNVWNEFFSWRAYQAQIKRWVVIPRQVLFPNISHYDKCVSTLLSLATTIPVILLIIGIVFANTLAIVYCGIALALSEIIYIVHCYLYTKRTTPFASLVLLLFVNLFTPVHLLISYVTDNTALWRGELVKIDKGGKYERVT
ncbi:glycosyltransferase [Candidatus Uabimicrobium amorphum]|uniref:Ceramide glucosyltransferase n=1 Tax=Uabimicrobium amorphum TaxID=2596890 RepID=A0A5S9II99_UABAM|nr:glycosyltransferase [Candidatus Uabimicrobium amorphum]BBM82077.1 ceramide glucosyltransferase [Candidatus Uabimicrobium amorphum]